MRSIVRKALVWSAFALFAGIAIGIELAPVVAMRGVHAASAERACAATLRPGRILATLRAPEHHCSLRRESGNWLAHPIAVASALGPLLIF